MVLFENTVVNQSVEVKTRHGVFKGIVKYKGCLNGIAGDWIGIHLSHPGVYHISGIRIPRTYVQFI